MPVPLPKLQKLSKLDHNHSTIDEKKHSRGTKALFIAMYNGVPKSPPFDDLDDVYDYMNESGRSDIVYSIEKVEDNYLITQAKEKFPIN